MRDFSIDNAAEKIHSSNTREYFSEVIKSYYSESFRSAVVMLYSITIADLIYKVEELKDHYNDASAIEILDEIKALQQKNQSSPEWESRLIELIKEKTNLLEVSDYANIISLQKHRHLCAHPVLNKSYELFQPNKEMTKAHIRNVLEGILIKPAMLSRKIFNDLLLELSNIKHLLRTDIELEKHLATKYFSKLGEKQLSNIFRSLWKITFKTKDKVSDVNREINQRTLCILIKNSYQHILQIVENEKAYYEDIDMENLYYLVILLNQFPKIFQTFNESGQLLISRTIEQEADLLTLAMFLSLSLKEHLSKVLEINYWDEKYKNGNIYPTSILSLFNSIKKDGQRDLAFEFLIKMFGNSQQYDQAESRYNGLIAPNMNEFTKLELKEIVKEVNKNSQIYDRRNARNSNNQIKRRIDELYEGKFDYTKYYYFKL